MKLWQGRTDAATSAEADAFNSSISFDSRMYRADIAGSIAHAKMLAHSGIITDSEAQTLIAGLEGILADLDSGALEIDTGAEDIHMFIEETLTARVGEAGKKLHTARSRNDQVALDLRLYLLGEIKNIDSLTRGLILALTSKAEAHADDVMPGYTHLQRAQPVTFGQHLLAYSMMFLRDLSRFSDCARRMNVSPIGSCALAGTTFDTDRQFESELLGFESVCENSMDGVSDRDFAIELLSDISILMMHISRLSEEMILWSSLEFSYIELDDAYTTGSSIMPQKKNPDMAELSRGKTGRVYGDLLTLLTVMKGLPLAYNKDMQEDKECVFDAVDTVKPCLSLMRGMIETMRVDAERMRSSSAAGFINATDLADYLVGKGLPFRTAYKLSGRLVARCAADGETLETLPLAVYREYSELIGEDVYDAVDLDACVRRRKSYGGTSPESVRRQVMYVRAALGEPSD